MNKWPRLFICLVVNEFLPFGRGDRNTLCCLLSSSAEGFNFQSLMVFMKEVCRRIQFECDLDISPCISVMYLPKTQLIEFRQLLVSGHILWSQFSCLYETYDACHCQGRSVHGLNLTSLIFSLLQWGQDIFLRTHFGVYILHCSCLSTFQLTTRNECTVLLLLPQQQNIFMNKSKTSSSLNIMLTSEKMPKALTFAQY